MSAVVCEIKKKVAFIVYFSMCMIHIIQHQGICVLIRLVTFLEFHTMTYGVDTKV